MPTVTNITSSVFDSSSHGGLFQTQKPKNESIDPNHRIFLFKRRYTMTKKLALALAAALALSTGQAYAASAPITWSAPALATGNASDVITTGTLFAAINSGASTTVNGVTFVGGGALNGSNVTFAGGVSFSGANLFNTSFGTAPGTWNSSYSALVNSGTSGDNGSTPTLSLSGLTVGNVYSLQIFEVYGNNGYGPWPTSFSAGGNTSSAVSTGTSSAPAPQFITGTFTANAATEAISLSGPSGYGVFSAVQVRTVSAVPESGTASLMGVGMLTFVFLGWRRRSA